MVYLINLEEDSPRNKHPRIKLELNGIIVWY